MFGLEHARDRLAIGDASAQRGESIHRGIAALGSVEDLPVAQLAATAEADGAGADAAERKSDLRELAPRSVRGSAIGAAIAVAALVCSPPAAVAARCAGWAAAAPPAPTTGASAPIVAARLKNGSPAAAATTVYPPVRLGTAAGLVISVHGRDLLASRRTLYAVARPSALG